MSKQSEEFRERAVNCTILAEAALSEPIRARYLRMRDAWLALAEEQEWLDGDVAPKP